MKCERLSDRRFNALKYNIVLQGFYFSSGEFCVCGITILFIYKVLLDERLKPFTVMLLLWWGSAGNNKVVGWCGGGGVVCRVAWCGVDSLRVGWLGCG